MATYKSVPGGDTEDPVLHAEHVETMPMDNQQPAVAAGMFLGLSHSL